MLARIAGAIVVGAEAKLVEVQVDRNRQGLPGTQTVGLPGTTVRESQERVRSAIRHAGLETPPARITVNLAPADLPKQGASLDLARAVAVLCAQEEATPLSGFVIAGELALDGTLRPIAGALPIACSAREAGYRAIILPQSNAAEAASIGGIDVLGVGDLREAFAILKGDLAPARADAPRFEPDDPMSLGEDLADVRGQLQARRAIEIAAAGAHNLLLIGPPGTGKTMLARRLRTILPAMSVEEAIEVTRITSAAGALPPGTGLVRIRPFRAPHQTITPVGLIGGGRDLRPGEVSLASDGVLFLDELPEFERRLLDLLRGPLEDGIVTLVRHRWRFTLPSRFCLVAGMNPCPCGYYGQRARTCRCTPLMIERYRNRISGPLWDRFDLIVEVPPVPLGDLAEARPGEDSLTVRRRVETARLFRRERTAGANGSAPAERWEPFHVRRPAPPAPPLAGLPKEAVRCLREAAARFALSARAVHRVLRVARTIADLGGRAALGEGDVGEALSYRRPQDP